MKKCLVCGFDNKDEARFCVKCGKNLIEQKPTIFKKTVFKRRWLWSVVLIIILLIFLQRLGYIGEDKTTYLVVSEQHVTFFKPGGIAGIDIDTDGRRWKVTHCPDWCDIDKETMLKHNLR